jgi:hypothetical protein
MKHEVKVGEKFEVVVIVVKDDEKEESGKLAKIAIIVALIGVFAFGAIGMATGDYHVFDTLGKVAAQVLTAAIEKGDGRKER